jgi:hypothetical protein
MSSVTLQVPSYVKGKSKGDSNKDLRPFALVQLVAVAGAKVRRKV